MGLFKKKQHKPKKAEPVAVAERVFDEQYREELRKLGREHFKKLVELGQNPSMIQNKIGTEVYQRYMPMIHRLYIDKTGNVKQDLNTAKKLQEIQQFRGR